MAEADKKDSRVDNKSLPHVDPAVEKKVDQMMDPKSSPPVPQNEKPSSTSAPLLPGEKIPNFDKSAQKKVAKTDAKEALKETPDLDKAQSLEEAVAKHEEQSSVSDPATDKAVDEIIAEESDRMLAIEDAKAQLLAEGTAEIDRGFWNRVKTGLSNFWYNRKARRAVLITLFLAIVAVFAIPTSRYFMLNSLGVRASTSLRVVDEKTGQPLKNVNVALDGKTTKTNKEGNAKLDKVKLGPNELSIKKPAFADVNQKVTIGWGSNPRGDIKLTAVGSRYSFNVTDFVSNKPVKAEATSGEASATANDSGEIVLVVADQDETVIEVSIAAENYRSEVIPLEVGDKNIHQLKLVPAKKHAFVSKRSGKYDLYKIDVDGKNEEKILAGTGSESADKIAILSHSKKNIAAYVSTRGDQRTRDGFALSSLMIVNLDDDAANTIDSSERLQLINFAGNKLVYVKIAEGESAESPNRHRLISYDIESEQEKELAHANYFNDVLSVGGTILYTPASFQSGDVGLFRINADGSNKTTVYGQEAWSLFRVVYDKVDVSVGQQWYEYNTVTTQFNALSGAPAEQISRVYADSPDSQKSAWVDDRDGKGVLIIYDVNSKEEKVLQTQSGLRNPISWLDKDHIVYRVSTGSETADYVISLSGGEPKKIVDVTNTAGLDRWYYY